MAQSLVVVLNWMHYIPKSKLEIKMSEQGEGGTLFGQVELYQKVFGQVH